MAWRYTKAGSSYSRPDSENGFAVEGPLTVEDWRAILKDIRYLHDAGTGACRGCGDCPRFAG